jgi:5'-nucleotidase
MKRSILRFGIALAILLGFCACETIENQADKLKKNTVIAVVSVNDIHSAIDLMPQFAAMLDSLRGIYPDLLVFSAGDNRTGNPVNDLYEPTNYPMINFMNKLGFDLCTVGNHDWDGGVESLQKNIEEADFPFLCANVVVPETVKLDVKPYEIIQRQGVNIAVLGVIETRASGIPGAHPRYFTEISFKRAMDVIPEYQFLKDQADIFILLSHLGYEDDLEVADRFPSFDAIFGGHTHTLTETPTKHNGVMVTQAGANLKNATLTLFMIRRGQLVDVVSKTLDVQHFRKKNAEVQAMLDEYNSDERFNVALTTATTNFDSREELGCMFTDAVRVISGADFAFNNTGGLRLDHLKKGPITVKDIYDIDPFNNAVVIFKMTGSQLEQFIMETYKKNGRYPSFVSGMTYTIKTDADRYPKSVEIKLDKGRFSKDAVYKVAMNSYMAETVRFESLDDGESQYMTTEEMVIKYLKGKKTVSYNGVRRAFR